MTTTPTCAPPSRPPPTPPTARRTDEARDAVRETLGLLDRGELRIAEKNADTGEWDVHAWAKQAILLFFRQAEMADHTRSVRTSTTTRSR